MSLSIHGLSVAAGIAIGRTVLLSSSRVDVAHYFIEPADAAEEINRVRVARNAVIEEINRLQEEMPEDVPPELSALLDVHLMLLNDETLIHGVKQWITERLYNAEWALTAQLEIIARQFDEMEEEYLRERKADLEQVVERILKELQRSGKEVDATATGSWSALEKQDDDEAPLVLIAHDLSPADMLRFKQSVFVGFATEVGGKTSHTAIVARSMGIPAVVGARGAGQLIKQDDWVIIDGDAGVMIVDPSPVILAQYELKRQQAQQQRTPLARLRNTPCITLDGQPIDLLANIELPEDTPSAIDAGASGVGLFRTEFLFMGKSTQALPDEEEQYLAYRRAVEGMQGRPVTIRTIDVGADKPLGRLQDKSTEHLNPALGLRAIRWSLADPQMFLDQLRAILRAAAHGKVNLLIPMLSHPREIHQTIKLLAQARTQLDEQGQTYGPIRLGAMIEVPAAALLVKLFLQYFDFLSIGTNDLIQYTLAIDRADESVAHLYDPLHPAVLRLIANTIAECQAQNKSVTVCGEMAGDVQMARLLLGLGLRSFSMHPAQILLIKQEILHADTRKLRTWAAQLLDNENPAALMYS